MNITEQLSLDSTLEQRASIPISYQAALSLIEWYERNPPPFYWMELGWDLRRLFGEDGWGLFNRLALTDEYEDPEKLEQAVDEAWDECDRTGPTQFDRLIIDAMQYAQAKSWRPKPEWNIPEPAVEIPIEQRPGYAEFQQDMREMIADEIKAHNAAIDAEWDNVMEEVRAIASAIDAQVRRRLPMNDYRRDVRQQIENNNPDNVEFFLLSLKCEVRFNAWLERCEIRGGNSMMPDLRWSDWTYLDDTIVSKLRTEAARTGIRFCPSREFMWDTLLSFAHTKAVDPAIELIRDLERAWDGVPRLDSWLSVVCGVPNDAYHSAVSRNILGGMVKRVRCPGCKHDEIAVLIGPQGGGKSTLISLLAPRLEWFTDSVRLGDEAKELVLSLAGKAVVEVSEMGTRTRDVNAIKAMISRTTDSGRTAYARSVTERPRRNLFVASTNDDSPLIDDTGNRRFLPVRIDSEINLAWFRENVSQLIGEAAAAHTAGADFAMPRNVWLAAATAQDAARTQAEYEIFLAEWFSETALAVFVTAADMSELVKAAAGRSVNANQYGKAMRKLGFLKGTKRVEGKPVAVWHRGDLHLASRIVPHHDRGRIVARLQIQGDTPRALSNATVPLLPAPR